jgi:hypothetical protein
MSREEAAEIFEQIDANGNGEISQIEFIKALRKDSAIAKRLGLPNEIRQEDESRKLFALKYADLDKDHNKAISLGEFLAYYSTDDYSSNGPGSVLGARSVSPVGTAHLVRMAQEDLHFMATVTMQVRATRNLDMIQISHSAYVPQNRGPITPVASPSSADFLPTCNFAAEGDQEYVKRSRSLFSGMQRTGHDRGRGGRGVSGDEIVMR